MKPRPGFQLPFSLDLRPQPGAGTSGAVRPPTTRAGCVGGMRSRMAGEAKCEAITCRYHLIGGLALHRRERGDEEAEALRVDAMRAWIEGDFLGTCALDIVDDAAENRRLITDKEIALMIGSTPSRVTQISAEAATKIRKALEENEHDSDYDEEGGATQGAQTNGGNRIQGRDDPRFS